MESKNDIFDLGRFGHYMRCYFRARRKSLAIYALSAVVILTLYAAAIFVHSSSSRIDVWIFATLFMFIEMCLCTSVASRAFRDMNSTDGMLDELTTPASQLEKFLARWLIGVPAPFIFCIVTMKGISMLGEYGMVQYYSAFHPEHMDGIELMKSLYSITASWLISIAWLQASFFLGASLWRKNSALKTFAVIAVALIFSVLVWGNYMPWLGVTYSRTATILLITLVPVCLYYAAWVMYRRAQVK